MDDRGARTDPFDPVKVCQCNQADARQWSVAEAGSTIRDFGTCLDAAGGRHLGWHHSRPLHLQRSRGQRANTQIRRVLVQSNVG